MKKSPESVPYKDIKTEDMEIRQILQDSVAYIEAPDHMKRRIDCRITEILEKEKTMKKGFGWKKVAIGVAAACLMVGTVCIAGSGIRYLMGHSSAIPTYTDYSDMEQAQADVGYQVKAVETFDNGFAFKDITISDQSLVNETGQKEESQKGIHISYENGKETVVLYIRQLYQQEIAEGNPLEDAVMDDTLQIGEVLAGFRQITNKFVPPDYELTEEDEKNMESPNFNLAYGTEEVEMDTGYSVLWVENNILYELYGTDLSISGSDMLHMAEELIQNGN
ncbi:MAG: hypothetical protein HFI91_03115 [Lachnospiraceae bacterium]|nr:hypothetical protein [Lachnospiraceae bacterium]